MPTRLIVTLGVVLFLSSCESTQSQMRDLTRPSYNGPVALVDQPTTIKIAPLNRKAALKLEVITKKTSGSKVKQSYEQISGTVESHQLGDNIQINYIYNRVGGESAFQPILPLVLQIEVDKTGKPQDLRLGSAMLDQVKPDERDVLQDYLLEMYKSTARVFPFIISSQPIAQGDVVQSARYSDPLKDAIAEMKVGSAQSRLAKITTSGSGFIGRLAGKTAFDGRPAYLILWDGNENIIEAEKSSTMIVSGYSLVDAATGLQSAFHILAKFSDQSSSGVDTREVLSSFRLKF